MGTLWREALLFGVHADHALGREMLDQGPEGLALAAARVEHLRIGRLARGNQPLEIFQRRIDDEVDPGLGAQEPEAEARFRHEAREPRAAARRRVVRLVQVARHRSASIARSVSAQSR
jgi:hypothetical protein